MAFPNRPGRRVNWDYVCRLCDELERLGHDPNTIPERVLRSTWPEIREYLMHNLDLQVCAWCKMPKSAAEMGNGQLCVDHETTMQETITQRRTVSTIRNKRRNWKMRKLYGEETDGPVLATSDIERIRKLETELGLKEPSALQPKTAVAAVLDALTRRPNGGK